MVLYETEDGRTRVECRFEAQTLWLTQALMAELFQATVPTVNEHLKGLAAEGEIGPGATIRSFRMVRSEGGREVAREIEHYSLPAILAVGYRVRSARGAQFRQWATARLTEYLVKGFTMDDERLKAPPGPGVPDYFDELLARIRDIRASEKRVYLRVKEILALAADYDPKSADVAVFFQTIQNKLHFAVTGKTAPELIAARADAAKPNMGLTSWKGGVVRKGDVTVAKNYLNADEIDGLNRFVVMFLDYAEDQAKRRKQVFLADWRTKLDIFVDAKKDAAKLDIVLPQLSAGVKRKPMLDAPTMDDVKRGFAKLQKLPLESKTDRVIDFEGRSLTTGELLTRLRIDLPLMATAALAVTYYVGLIEAECKVQGLFPKIGGLIQSFVEEVLFDQPVGLFDARLAGRLGDPDVATHVLHVFVPLVRARTTATEVRAPELPPVSLKDWKPYKASHSERNPCKAAAKTIFNLIPCRGGLEAALVPGLDLHGNGIAAFAKNAGPQSLRIDYVKANGQLSTYTPDFFVRGDDGAMYLVETKGREDTDVSRKARAAVAWCDAASGTALPGGVGRDTGRKPGATWQYVYVTENGMQAMSGGEFAHLVRACAPALQTLVHEKEIQEAAPLFAEAIAKDVKAARPAEHYKRMAGSLRKTLLFQSGLMPLGLLRECLDYALNDKAKIGGVFDSVKQAFLYTGSRKVLEEVSAVSDYRNKHVAHQETPITDAKPSGLAMGRWIRTLAMLTGAPPVAHSTATPTP